ncbi:MAG: ATP-binding cassette domain-containing protein [Betaproteobacteria bacterium]|nr:ATP-binding cassette domain-containing protein [Betaproteobacteria bacterium]
MITLKSLTLRRGAHVVLDDASLTLHAGEKVGLVGRNGAGKSSLFALLAGTLHEDGGSCHVPAQARLAQVSQELPETEESATRFVMQGDTALVAAQEEVAAAEASGDGERMAHAYLQLEEAGVHEAPSRAQSLILGLGFPVAAFTQPVNSFSGGWRMRLQLARALMCPSDLLLLDEPTNHLDLDALVWLEAWLQRYPGTLLVISHDREFLDAVTRVTVHLEQGRLTRYGGNYSTFETQRAAQLALQQSAYEKQQAQVAHLQQFIDRFKAKASKAKQAQSRVKALARLTQVAPLLAEADFTFEFQPPAALPNPMLTLQGVSAGYSGRGVLQQVNATVLAGQRIGILGANGQGKSTLVKTMVGTLPPLAGDLTRGKGLSIGYFAQQEMDLLEPRDTPLGHFLRLARTLSAEGRLCGQDTREQALRNVLGQFHFGGERIGQAVGTLSGGEKARLVLALIVWQRPNLLLLDEPTNHLDLATREALSVALNEFEGTVLLVSHDRALLRTVCDEFWLVARGSVAPFEGDLDDYQRFLLEEARRAREAAPRPARPAAPPAPVAAPQAPPKVSRRVLEKLERQMEGLNRERDALHQRLEGLTVAADIAAIGTRLQALETELAALEEEWLRSSGA